MHHWIIYFINHYCDTCNNKEHKKLLYVFFFGRVPDTNKSGLSPRLSFYQWEQASHDEFGKCVAYHLTSITVYPKKYALGFVVLCFVVVKQSFIMNSHVVFIHIHQGCFAGTGAIVRLPQCQWSKPDGYGKISQCITTTKHSKVKTVCIFLGIDCNSPRPSDTYMHQ